jgi:hypothetical protein
MAKNWEQKGDILTVLESTLTPQASGLIQSGAPAFWGAGDFLTGVAQNTALASTDLIPMDRKGVYRLLVTGRNETPADEAVAIGDKLYIDDAEDQLNKDFTLGTFFGYALGTVTSGGTATIPVLQKAEVG